MRILTILSLALIAGCASTSPEYNDYRPAPSGAEARPMCSSSGKGGAAGCAGAVVQNAVIHEASK